MSVVWESNLLSSGVSPELQARIPDVIKECHNQGLDPFPLAIEEYTADEIVELAAYGGFPVRYPHFSFGQQYETLHHQYHSGMGKIYEMVVNTNPTYMYLQANNPIVDNLTVVAHALAHSDFFKNNITFKHTDRNMMNIMSMHGQKIRKYMDMYGRFTVSAFLDACLSINDLIDPALVWKSSAHKKPKKVSFDDRPERVHVSRIDTKDYLDKFVNTDQYIEQQRKENKKKRDELKNKFPENKERDILLFIINNERLKPWQQNILSMIRDEAIYYRPQILTKVMNEGWASYWDSYIMTKCGFAGDDGIFDYAKHHSGVLGGKYNMNNPYKLGNTLFNDIKTRWDKGQFGKQWDNCEDIREKRKWNLNLNKGKEKIFDVRENYCDTTFINEYFTEEFCMKNKFFEYQLEPYNNKYIAVSKDYKKIKQKILKQYINGGKPMIYLEDAKYRDTEILLYHEFERDPLDINYAEGTLKMLHEIVQRPVNIRTVKVSEKATAFGQQTYLETTPVIYRYDGSIFHTKLS
jgi:stage V sporulation protein R